MKLGRMCIHFAWFTDLRTSTWVHKVEELAERGITIRQLLDFYADLGAMMLLGRQDGSQTARNQQNTREREREIHLHPRRFRRFGWILMNSQMQILQAQETHGNVTCKYHVEARDVGQHFGMRSIMRPHFDPERSTTHDVVRQAIIPNSLHYRTGKHRRKSGQNPWRNA